MNYNHTDIMFITSSDIYGAFLCELESVFHKIHKNLFKTSSITNELGDVDHSLIALSHLRRGE